jgi:metallo-beta-lactamase family protein
MSDARHPGVPLLHFLGGAGTVTGSRFLVETPRARVLVDCGLFQGLKELRLRNWEPFAVPPGSIDAVILTHAHVDHSGYLPRLIRDGFRGPVFCTASTLALSRVVLADSGHLQEEDAAYANRKGFSKHTPALPLYTEEDAWRAVERMRAVDFGSRVEVASGAAATLRPAGHILGSASVTLELDGAAPRSIVFSGDLGRLQHPLLLPPAPPPAAHTYVVESTYGDRTHDDAASLARFEQAIVRTAARGGTVVMPSFAVDRIEVILLHLRRLMRERRIPSLPVYVDSPLALAGLAIYRAAIGDAAPDVRPGMSGDGDPFDPGHLVETREVTQSRAINDQAFPSIILAASGMATGGRVLHHLARRLPDPRNSVILPGYQAAGTRGRLLQEGARMLKLLGRYVPVRAEIVDVPAFSVHADQGEILAWLARAPQPPEALFVVHGEPDAAAALREAVLHKLGWLAAVPKDLERVRLD